MLCVCVCVLCVCDNMPMLTCADVDECQVLSPNGFCSQVCVNTEGSFHCDCMEGYQLFRSFLCTGLYLTTKKLSRQYQTPYADIDECSEGIDTCSKSGPTPARCINTEGSYRCTCDEYVGYRLSTNGTTCEGMCIYLFEA